MKRKLRFKRLLLKVSGDVLGGAGTSIEFDRVAAVAEELREAVEAGSEIAVVIGGGNILRGYRASEKGVDRVAADCMGMLGGWAIGVTGLGINSTLYIAKSVEALVLKDIYTGLLKSFIFSILIALVSCHQGLSVSGGADAVGKATTQAVVISIVLIIVVDCLATAVIYYALPT